jgi:hypothetical protein
MSQIGDPRDMARSRRIKETVYDHCSTVVDRHHQQVRGEWFRTFKWDWFLTLTFSRDLSNESASRLLEEYLSALEAHVRAPLSCLIAREQKHSGLGMPAERVHFHLLVGCGKVLPKAVFSDFWEQPRYGGTRVTGEPAMALPYDPAQNASFYLFKQLSNPRFEWSIRRLELVSPIKPGSCATSSRARRSLRRQAERYSKSAIVASMQEE